ncbi:MAG: HAMP domain-containing histidine kinase [Lachnospiraceae bacterium]|nr:HAMP domain-containing histidine kinase [Lachnospiraceae bacterium]
MKKLLYSTPGKILVIAIMLFSAVCCAVSMSWGIIGLGAGMTGNILHPQPYAKSAEMIDQYLIPETHDFISFQSTRQTFYKDGALDMNETVDISDLNAGIYKANKNPDLTYTLKDLRDFYYTSDYVFLAWILENRDSLIMDENGDDGYYDEEGGEIIPPDDSLQDNKPVYGDTAVPTGYETVLYDNILYDLSTVYIDTARDRNGNDRIRLNYYPELYNVLYNNVRPLELQSIQNAAGGTIADYAQQNLYTVSILDQYTNLLYAAEKAATLGDYSKYYATNAMIWLQRTEDGQIFTNVDAWNSYDLSNVEKDYQMQFAGSTKDAKADSSCYYCAYNDTNSNTTLFGDSEYQASAHLGLTSSTLGQANELLGEGHYNLFIGLNPEYPIKDTAMVNNAFYQQYSDHEPFGKNALPAGIIFAGLFIFMLVLTVLQTGHIKEDNAIHTTAMEKFPIELLVIIDIVLWVVLLVSVSLPLRWAYTYQDSLLAGVDKGAALNNCYHTISMHFLAGLIPGAIAFGILLCWIFKHYIRRIKARTLGNSLLKSLFIAIRKVTISAYRTQKEGKRLVIVYILIAAGNAIVAGVCALAMAMSMSIIPAVVGIIILVLGNIMILRKLMTYFAGRDAVRKGMDEIASGNLDYKVDLDEATGYNREMAEGVNQVSAGLKHAVENEMKSERMKAELITNVSHDIKTPLTSIINYVDILKRHDIEDDEVRSYIEILDRKSARLKQLVDDLVESSKISSGNITLDMHSIDLSQMIRQMNGEFREKFEERNLSLVCNLPDEPMMIQADGARLCRVIENLYGNAAKYSMPGSRVYVEGVIRSDTDSSDSTVIFTIRNISEHALNISAEELTERFVRGDLSRNTEGSGLGLEIARNLTIMQGGTFDIILDGDLFKVVIGFPQLL